MIIATNGVAVEGRRMMAQQALGPGTTVRRRRAMFGLLDADGWTWAGVKAFVWLIIIIFLLGYIPDRAYYLTVNRTVDLGVLAWSPINLCPPTNESLPCPAPVGAITPWHESPAELNLPAPRTDGSATQLGTKILYIGGTDGTAAQSTVSLAELSGSATSTSGPRVRRYRSLAPTRASCRCPARYTCWAASTPTGNRPRPSSR